jgi:hypothetical protein
MTMLDTTELAPQSLALTPAELASATAELKATGVPFDYAASPSCLPVSAFAAMRSVWQAFADGVAAFVGRHDGRLADLAAELRVPADVIEPWQSFPETQWGLIGRPDMVMSSGVPMMVDVNMTGFAGLLPLNDMLLRSHRVPGVARAFPQSIGQPRYIMGHYTDILRRYLTPDDGIIAITLYKWEAEDPGFPRWLYETERHELARFGLPAQITFVEDLDITPGGVFVDGRKVSLIRRFFFPTPGNAHERSALKRISSALRNSQVRVLTCLQEQVLDNKCLLGALSDERFTNGLAPSLVARLRHAIPWTRIVEERHTSWQDSRIDLLPWMVANRGRLILKPSLGLGGRGVTVGRETSERDWAAIIDTALTGAEAWVVQELLEPDDENVIVAADDGALRRLRVPAVYGCYVLEGQFVGAIRRYGVRGAEFRMINGTVDAVPSPVYWR